MDGQARKPLSRERRERGADVQGRRAGSGEITAPALLLTTTGRKSGDKFIFPLFYGTEGDSYIIVASKGGAPEHPGWYRNILANPEVEVQVGTKKLKARARTVEGEERAGFGQKRSYFGRLTPTMRSKPTARYRWSCSTRSIDVGWFAGRQSGDGAGMISAAPLLLMAIKNVVRDRLGR